MPFTPAQLKAEIIADPQALGLSPGGNWIADQAIADLLNAQSYTIDRATVPAPEILGAVHYEAYNDLLVDEQEYIRWITTGDVKITADIKTRFTGRALTIDGTAGTGDDTASWWSVAERAVAAAALLAVLEIPGSRAEVLWGQGTRISARDVGAAANA